jgi:hypothetical protein
MTTVYSICEGVIAENDAPPIVSPSGIELVSHGMHENCARVYYGEDFEDILAGEPT